MIHYDSHYWRTLLQVRGSVFPKSVAWALLSAALAALLKYLDMQDIIDGNALAPPNSAAYSGFTFTLGFVLVFRTSQCYSRFSNCASSMYLLRSQYFEAGSTLCALAAMSKKPYREVREFKHKLIRLFSMIHAASLEAISDLENENFPILDVQSVPMRFLKALDQCDSRSKVELLYQWINHLIVEAMDDGLLNCPPPILTRVFQELERAIVAYKDVLHYKDIPFPFPYAQAAVCFVLLYLLVTPIVMLQWTQHWAISAMYTFISAFCLLSVELIATELENPFGGDANDLPAKQFQTIMNEDLLILLDPAASMKFELRANAKRSHGELVGDGVAQRRYSFQEWATESRNLGDFGDSHEPTSQESKESLGLERDHEIGLDEAHVEVVVSDDHRSPCDPNTIGERQFTEEGDVHPEPANVQLPSSRATPPKPFLREESPRDRSELQEVLRSPKERSTPADRGSRSEGDVGGEDAHVEGHARHVHFRRDEPPETEHEALLPVNVMVSSATGGSTMQRLEVSEATI